MAKRITVAATGASGMPLLEACLKLIRQDEQDWEVSLILSRSAVLTLHQETSLKEEDLYRYADHFYSPSEIGAPPASGSYQSEGMLIVPCSMKTVAGIVTGYSDNLILRSADVTVKEQRTLVLAAREAPMSPVHLRNLHDVSLLPGVRVIPPMMTFYNNPQSIEDMVNHMAAKLVEPFGIESPYYCRWNGLQ